MSSGNLIEKSKELDKMQLAEFFVCHFMTDKK